MFTGIIKEIGIVRRMDRSGSSSYRVEIEAGDIVGSANIGDSVSVNGVCLTLTEKDGNVLAFDVSGETVRKSGFKCLRKGECVNLEDSLRSGGAIGGHFVLGHIDCVGAIRGIARGEEFALTIEIPEAFSRLIVEKGSITIDGISLTLTEVSGNIFKVYVIPHTLNMTTLAFRKNGDTVNVEFDIIGKYLDRFNIRGAGGPEHNSRVTESFLRDEGFI